MLNRTPLKQVIPGTSKVQEVAPGVFLFTSKGYRASHSAENKHFKLAEDGNSFICEKDSFNKAKDEFTKMYPKGSVGEVSSLGSNHYEVRCRKK